MIGNNRHRIDKSNQDWDKAVKHFDKYLADMPESVLEQLYEIFKWDVPAAKKEDKELRERIKKAEQDAEINRLKLEVFKSRYNAS